MPAAMALRSMMASVGVGRDLLRSRLGGVGRF
jgi:hypothetical protein